MVLENNTIDKKIFGEFQLRYDYRRGCYLGVWRCRWPKS